MYVTEIQIVSVYDVTNRSFILNYIFSSILVVRSIQLYAEYGAVGRHQQLTSLPITDLHVNGQQNP
jgi:hypothetical protein